MSNIYGDQHRELQQHFDTTQLADRLEQMIVKTGLDWSDQAFIASRDMFFLSTIDHLGRPTVSYKGGDPGFIHIVDDQTIAFPSYDGNGMFLSMGNIQGSPDIGCLFMDMAQPNRLRLQGRATIDLQDPLLTLYPEADLVVRVAIQQVWVNCPRYIHRYDKVEASQFVPRVAVQTPIAPWKRLDAVQDVLPAKDAGRAAAAGGVLTPEEYGRLISGGETSGATLDDN